MFRNRVLLGLGGFLLASSGVWADELGSGFVDCHTHPEKIQVATKAAKTTDTVASIPCGERFTVLINGEVFARIETKDGKVGYIYSYLVTRDYSSEPTQAAPTPATQIAQSPSAPTQAQLAAKVTAPASSLSSETDDSRNSSSASSSGKIVAGSKVYIENMNGFENYLAAAFAKKKVQLVLVADKNQADYIVTGTSEDKKAGWAKIVFLGDVHSDADASITMVDKRSSTILFAYSVNKKSTLHGAQTTAEACAKHLHEKIDGEK
jgi:hypothetical protein